MPTSRSTSAARPRRAPCWSARRSQPVLRRKVSASRPSSDGSCSRICCASAAAVRVRACGRRGDRRRSHADLPAIPRLFRPSHPAASDGHSLLMSRIVGDVPADDYGSAVARPAVPPDAAAPRRRDQRRSCDARCGWSPAGHDHRAAGRFDVDTAPTGGSPAPSIGVARVSAGRRRADPGWNASFLEASLSGAGAGAFPAARGPAPKPCVGAAVEAVRSGGGSLPLGSPMTRREGRHHTGHPPPVGYPGPP
jgi:hypothetical protein